MLLSKDSVYLSVFCLLIVSTISFGQQGQKWEGSIDNEDGVRTVKNPMEPLYGDIALELDAVLVIKDKEASKYRFFQISRIIVDEDENIFALDIRRNQIYKFSKEGIFINRFGRRGQGPGEFERPIYLFINKPQQIFVSDVRKIHVFNNSGEYIKGLSLNHNFTEFISDNQDNIIAVSHVVTEDGTKKSIVKYDSKGKETHKLADFETVQAEIRKNEDGKPSSLTVYHEYNYLPYMYPKDNTQFYYGYPSMYKLYLMDNSGNINMVIEKKESPQSITRKEKNHIVDGIEKQLSRMNRRFSRVHIEDACKFPPHRPFFNGIFSDENGILFIARVSSVIEEEGSNFNFDIFNSEGIYLYKSSLPFAPSYIDKGCIYRIRTNEDSGETNIIKYKVKNWNKVLRNQTWNY